MLLVHFINFVVRNHPPVIVAAIFITLFNKRRDTVIEF